MNLSIVVPLFNEEESLTELYKWVRGVLTPLNISFEVIFVDDGSNDGSWQVIEDLSVANQEVKGIKFRRNYGKSAALYSGFEAAEGDVVITMDADLQDNPNELPELYRMIIEDGYDLVSGWKKKRYDPLGKTIPSKLFNRTARYISGIKLHDFNCGLKAIERMLSRVLRYMVRCIVIFRFWPSVMAFRRLAKRSLFIVKDNMVFLSLVSNAF
ncbi:glycosyltransferase family 2 protein [Saccharicrinis fermentans]|uniref:Undecaprenyl-phosphate 4-deoxy-4-formamido-L-arabinose transferase n=1 Tax=Saccharicrinis fermentans DSM 9555 = JCM 21142 TaxID=869213 RepID=W7Y6J5_9BACT|nr:glycosyltransferase family 2 protein [Saccharicrinis fermentans]GAF03832.1 undecaprenyl-phosphate 4-deoxy-4-formamido-L-arabinose transferase [Saccharicrinis fermentans DSM 9555 = JCM 21142]